MTNPYTPSGPRVWQDQVGYEDYDDEGDGYSSSSTQPSSDPSTQSGSGTTAYPTGVNTQGAAATGGTTTTAPGSVPGSGQNAHGQPDPTAPLADGSSNVQNTLTGPAATSTPTTGSGGGYVPPASPSSGQLFGDAQSDLQQAQNTQGAPQANQYEQDFHNFNEHDYKQNEAYNKAFPKGSPFSFDGISNNDKDRLKFGTEEPDKVTAAQTASKNGNAKLEQYASSINGGDTDAIGKADDILKQGEPGLAFFKFFAPAYGDWTGNPVNYGDLKKAYEAEYGMSFSAYSGDTKTIADISQQVEDISTNLNNAYNGLVPQWSGAAAQAFEQKMAVFFQAAGTVHQDLGVVGKDISALVQGLQQLILAKAQTVASIYLDMLPTGIDGVMASTMVKVAKGQADKATNLIAFKLLGGTIKHSSGWSVFDVGATIVTGGAYGVAKSINDQAQQNASEDAANDAAPSMAANWCNQVLIPQFEARYNALTSVDAETKGRIQQGFQAFTQQFQNIQDPFTGMDKVGNAKPVQTKPGDSATTPAGVTVPGGSTGAGTGGSTGSGTAPVAPTPSLNTGVGTGTNTGSGTPTATVQPVPTLGTGTGTTTPQGVDPGTGSTTGTGLPTGTGVDPGTGLPTGTGPGTGTDSGSSTTRPAGLPTGAGWIASGTPLPSGWSEDPSTGQVLPPGWKLDPLTGQAVGHDGTTTAGTGTGTGKIDPKDDIHKNKDGSVSLGEDKSVTIGTEGKKGVFTIKDTDPDGTEHTYRVHFDHDGNPVVTEVEPKDGTDTSGIDAAAAASGKTELAGLTGGGGGGGIGSSGIGSIGSGGIGGGSTTHPTDAGAAAHASSTPDLQAGTSVGADNSAMSATGSAGANSASPVAGSAAGAGHQQSSTGTTPFLGGGGRGAGGGGSGGEEHARKYGHKEDVVGEADLEEWQRMGPVIGEN